MKITKETLKQIVKEVRQQISEEADGMAHTGAIENLTRIKARESEDYVGHEKSAFEHGFDAYAWEQGYGSIDPGDPKKMDWYNTSGSWWDAYTKGDALAARVISATYTGQEQDLDDYGANIDNVTSAPGPYRQEDEEGSYTDSEGTEWDPATHAGWERKKAAGLPADPLLPSTRQPHAREVIGAFQSLGDAALRGSQVAMRRLKTAAKTNPDAQAILDDVTSRFMDKTVSPAASAADTMLEKKSIMNITKKQLAQIIREELEATLAESDAMKKKTIKSAWESYCSGMGLHPTDQYTGENLPTPDWLDVKDCNKRRAHARTDKEGAIKRR